MTRFMGN